MFAEIGVEFFCLFHCCRTLIDGERVQVGARAFERVTQLKLCVGELSPLSLDELGRLSTTTHLTVELHAVALSVGHKPLHNGALKDADVRDELVNHDSSTRVALLDALDRARLHDVASVVAHLRGQLLVAPSARLSLVGDSIRDCIFSGAQPISSDSGHGIFSLFACLPCPKCINAIRCVYRDIRWSR